MPPSSSYPLHIHNIRIKSYFKLNIRVCVLQMHDFSLINILKMRNFNMWIRWEFCCCFSLKFEYDSVIELWKRPRPHSHKLAVNRDDESLSLTWFIKYSMYWHSIGHRSMIINTSYHGDLTLKCHIWFLSFEHFKWTGLVELFQCAMCKWIMNILQANTFVSFKTLCCFMYAVGTKETLVSHFHKCSTS